MRVRTPQDIGLAIKDRRLALGMDQAELANRIGVSRQWLVEIEKGKPRAEIGLLLRALRELELDIWVGELPPAETPPTAAIDLSRIIDKARGEPDGD